MLQLLNINARSSNTILTFRKKPTGTIFKGQKSNKNPLDSFNKNKQTPNFIKIRPLVAELLHADRQTGTKKLIITFRNFVKAANNHETSVNTLNLPFISQSILV